MNCKFPIIRIAEGVDIITDKIIIGSDHGGLELKEFLKNQASEIGIELVDIGTYDNKSVDYPDFGSKVAKAVSNGEYERGILVCGTGIGMSIVANRYAGVRGTLCHNIFTARMAREHNNSNLLVLGGRILGKDLAKEIFTTWLNTEFAGDRHQRRLDKIENF